VLLVAVPAVYRPVTRRLKGYFGFLAAIGASHFMHFLVATKTPLGVTICHFLIPRLRYFADTDKSIRLELIQIIGLKAMKTG
jgi:hypothetical protein